MKCTWSRSRQGRDELSCWNKGRLSVYGPIEWHEGTQGTFGMGRRTNQGWPTFAQQEHRDGGMMGYFLGDTAQNPAFHAGVAMTAEHNEINGMRLHNREDAGRGLTYDYSCLGVNVLQAVHVREALQIVSGHFQFSVAGAL
jgi:hypothetical protein